MEQKVPLDWLPKVNSDKIYWFWTPEKWSATQPKSEGSYFALSSIEDNIILEVFVLGINNQSDPLGFVVNIMKSLLKEDHPDLRIIHDDFFQLNGVDNIDVLSRMEKLGLMNIYGFVSQLRAPSNSHRLCVEYSERNFQRLESSTKTISDCFFPLQNNLVLQINIKTLSSNYNRLAPTFETIINSAKLGEFA